ncbi:WXG100 family type VII secretion target [Actinoplanes awajinensis]|uniref:Outer membrane channel protein CpnT-like N-terminal domain-containing protein n=1 Tax=Actinoplanes awajinensis subsp. mycoplanecinus TaxID=135947 RepID=A0A0X3V7G4_9ACTN|nr:WXG100 family type VII secretion target [Actinoplanes awajinensis]KUL40628.1 hypothetical protein ADL15_06475 [Actinoplanes awajinensis subsp. mycoplanecinus]
MTGKDIAEGFQNTRDAVSNVTTPMSQGVNTVLDAVLYPFVAPLLELLELVAGDPDQLEQHAATWTTAAQSVKEMAGQQRTDLASLRAEWTGSAADAYAARINQLVEGLDAAALDMLNTADGLRDRAMDLRNIEEVIKEIIRELVEWLIIQEIAKHALAAFTAGVSEGVITASEMATAAVEAARAGKYVLALRKILVSYRIYIEGLKAAGGMSKVAAWTFDKLYGPKHWLKTGLKLVTGLDGSIIGQPLQAAEDLVMDAAADEYDDRRSGIDGDGGFRSTVSEYVDPVADRVP